jgi:hypothetical protein
VTRQALGLCQTQGFQDNLCHLSSQILAGED